MIEISEALDSAAIAAARTLFEEYQEALGIDLSFQSFANELETLPGDYASPRGRLLLARDKDAIAGCVAMRPLTEETCEMKRLYVRSRFRAEGVGRQLAERVIAEARSAGYQRMYLDTLPTMADAQRLYEKLGFKEIPAYRHNPIAGTRFLGLGLR
jgi:ribosomal protein S18 acetylase RimI-like enzyme